MRLSAALLLSILSVLMLASVAYPTTAADHSGATGASRADQLRNAEASLEQVRGEIVEVHQAVVSDLPTLWPLIDGLGQVTMEFGPNIRPIMNAWHIEIEHPYGFRTKYTHMSRIDVARGEAVEQGQRIGALGSSGLSTGPHLHFEIQLGTELIDPAYFLKLSKPNFNRRVLDRY